MKKKKQLAKEKMVQFPELEDRSEERGEQKELAQEISPTNSKIRLTHKMNKSFAKSIEIKSVSRNWEKDIKHFKNVAGPGNMSLKTSNVLGTVWDP